MKFIKLMLLVFSFLQPACSFSEKPKSPPRLKQDGQAMEKSKDLCLQASKAISDIPSIKPFVWNNVGILEIKVTTYPPNPGVYFQSESPLKKDEKLFRGIEDAIKNNSEAELVFKYGAQGDFKYCNVPFKNQQIFSNVLEVSSANNRFALELYRNIVATPGNMFFSPYSISSALTMTAAGAQEQTLAEMLKVLHLPPNSHTGYKSLLDSLQATSEYELLIANRLWGRANKKYNPSFLDILKLNYNADLQPMDFEGAPEPSRIAINQWVEKKTKNLIKDLIPIGGINQVTDLVITNAIYFKGRWVNEFKIADTKQDDFYTQPNKRVKTSFMNQTTDFNYAENSDLQLLELPYKGDQLTMSIVLPRKEIKFSSWELKITDVEIEKLAQTATEREVILSLPKFKAESKLELSDQLKELGMPLAFDDKKANFSNIRKLDNDEIVYISKVIHNAFVNVNEEGTEAAAATAMALLGSGGLPEPLPPVIFKANRPFLFFIKHKASGTILFLGRYVQP